MVSSSFTEIRYEIGKSYERNKDSLWKESRDKRVIVRMKRDVSKDKIFDRVLIRISYQWLNSDENFDLNHQKTLELAVHATNVW